MLAADTVPLVVLLLVGGVIAGRFSRRFSMLGSDLWRCATEALLAALLLTGTPPLWALTVLAGALGVGQAMCNPAMTGLIPQLVSAGHLQQANAVVDYDRGDLVGDGGCGVEGSDG